MTRQEMIAAILAFPDPELQSEISYHLDIDREDDGLVYDEFSALLDTELWAEDNCEKKLLASARKILIEIGYYTPMTRDEIESTIVSSGSKWSFKMSGTAYRPSDDRPDQFVPVTQPKA